MESFAINVLIFIFSATIIFHLLIMMKIVPSGIIWGGRIKSDRQMYRLEMVSISLNIIFLIFMLIIGGNLNLPVHNTVIKISLWIMTCLFLLNTIGNIFSANNLERMVFTPVTLIITCLLLVLVLS